VDARTEAGRGESRVLGSCPEVEPGSKGGGIHAISEDPAAGRDIERVDVDGPCVDAFENHMPDTVQVLRERFQNRRVPAPARSSNLVHCGRDVAGTGMPNRTNESALDAHATEVRQLVGDFLDLVRDGERPGNVAVLAQ